MTAEVSAPSDLISLAARIQALAKSQGGGLALVEISPDGEERSLTWSTLYLYMERVAARLHAHGIGVGSFVLIGLKNSLEHIIASLAAWQLGACCMPVSAEMTQHEQLNILELVTPQLIVSDCCVPPEYRLWQLTGQDVHEICMDEGADGGLPGIPMRLASPCRAMATGASTGKAKLVVQHVPMAYTVPGLAPWEAMTGQRTGQRQLVPGALCHMLYSSALFIGLFMGQTVYIMQKFRPATALRAIETHRIQCAGFVPTMMEKMLHCPDIDETDLGSLEAIFHAGGACSATLKRAWIQRLGAEKIYEFYAMTEMIGSSGIRGDDWLKHPGSVGQPTDCKVKICGEDGNALPPGEIGEIFCRPHSGVQTNYIGQSFLVLPDGYCSVGDLGWLDEDHYLYIADRRSDMIVTGGKNVYSLQIENVLCEFPLVRDAAVIGLPDAYWGRRVHAIIEPKGPIADFPLDALERFCRDRISDYKLPKSFEFVPCLPRDEMGKLQHRKLVEERMSLQPV